MPHITVLYVRGDLQDHGTRIYDEFQAKRLTLVRPGTFDPPSRTRYELSTLYIQCESPEIEFLHHKPDYPDSFLHISLYDGPPSVRANEVLDVLREFPWDLNVELPDGRLSTRIRKPSGGGTSTLLTEGASALLEKLTDGGLGPSRLGNIDGSDLRNLVVRIAAYLHGRLPSATSIGRPAGTERTLPPTRMTEYQDEFWPAIRFLDPSRAGMSRAPDTDAHRRGGVFLTPPELAYDITQAAVKSLPTSGSIDFGDPAIGSGVFLASVVNELGEGRIGTSIGVESDALRGHLTHDRWRALGLDIVIGDFVTGMLGDDRYASSVDGGNGWIISPRTLILANPPYIRSQRLDAREAASWRRKLQRKHSLMIDARSDLYVYFVLAAHDWLVDGGISAWLLPTEFMFTNYGEAIRSYLAREVTLIAVHSYDGPSKFTNARVTSCAVIFKKARPSGDAMVRFSAGGIISDSYVERSVRQAELSPKSKWHLIADEGVNQSSRDGILIGDLFRVRRGIATGNNKLFLLDSERARLMGAPREWLVPVVPRSRYIDGDTILADEFGDPIIGGIRWLIDVDAEREEINRRAPMLAEYLYEIEPSVMQSTLVKRRALFYKQEHSVPASFIFSYMARDEAYGRRFFLNKSRAVILNNYLGLYPYPTVENWLAASDENQRCLLACLREIRPTDFARAGRVYVEGLTKVEPRELSALRLRSLPPGLEAAIRARP